MTDTPLHDQLANLEADLADAKAQRREAKADAEARQVSLAQDLAGDLHEFHHAIEFNQPGATPTADREAREAELIAAIFEEIRERRLTVKPSTNLAGLSLQVQNVRGDADFAAADDAKAAAERAVLAFREKHAFDLNTERRLAETLRFREAANSGDLDTVSEMLNQHQRQTPSSVFTTEDLPGGGVVHNRSAARAAV
jgi:hypothetical protein